MAADEQFECSDWVPQQNKVMMDSIRHFKTTYGTLGDLFDATPIDVVSKVYFEDMFFETWNHGRTVLIGDGMYFFLLVIIYSLALSTFSSTNAFCTFISSISFASRPQGKKIKAFWNC